MSFPTRFFLLGSTLLLAMLCLTCGLQVPDAHAASVSAGVKLSTRTATTSAQAWVCASRSICFYQNEDGTGQSIACPTSQCHGSWRSTTVAGQHAGSVYDNSGSIFFVADKQTNQKFCELPGAYNLFHNYGYYYVEYGVTSCNGVSIPPGP